MVLDRHKHNVRSFMNMVDMVDICTHGMVVERWIIDGSREMDHSWKSRDGSFELVHRNCERVDRQCLPLPLHRWSTPQVMDDSTRGFRCQWLGHTGSGTITYRETIQVCNLQNTHRIQLLCPLIENTVYSVWSPGSPQWSDGGRICPVHSETKDAGILYKSWSLSLFTAEPLRVPLSIRYVQINGWWEYICAALPRGG